MATYYVDATTGDDDDSGLTDALAWATIAKVNASIFSPGDSVLFKRGETWLEQLTIPSSGAPDSPITFGAYGIGNIPVISGAGIRTKTILIDSKSYVTISDLDCRNAAASTQASVYVNHCSGIILDGLTVANNISYAGIYIRGTGNGNSIQKCTVSYTAHATADRGDGIIIDGPGRNHSVIDCISHHNHASGIKEKLGSISEALTIRGCTVYQNGAAGISINGDGTGPSDCIIEHSHSYENGQIESDYWGIDLFKCGYNNIIRFNHVHDDNYIAVSSGGIRLDANPGNVFGTGTRIHYNIVYNVRDGIQITAPFDSLYNNIVYGVEETAILINDDFVTTGTVKNNITHAVAGKHVRYQYATGVTFDHNYYYGGSGNWYGGGATRATFALWQAAISGDAHSANADPELIDPANYDFRLADNSPCINAGTDVGLTEDFEGNIIKDIPDIGVYEYQEKTMAKKTIPFTLGVTAAPDFFPAISPTSLSVVKGVVAVYQVSFTAQGGFTGPVTLAVLNLPTGAVATFDKTSVNVGETSILSIATSSVVVGSYSPSVEGTANL